MARIGKCLSLSLVIILAVSNILLIIKPTDAQTIPKPSVPEFTLKLTKSSYNVVDPYTGVAQQVDNSSIEFTIKNQTFTYSSNDNTYRLYYNFRMKPHFGGSFTEQYPVIYLPNSPYNSTTQSFSRSNYIWDNPPPPTQSNSGYTVVSYVLNSNTTNWALSDLPPNSQMDFQVEAIVGHDSQRWVVEHPLNPSNGGYYGPATAYDTDSGWSDTQTITIGETSATSPTPNPSPTPSVPEFSWLTILTLLLFSPIVLIIIRRRLLSSNSINYSGKC